MTFVQKQLVPVQFGGGIDTKPDPKQLQAGKLLTLQDGQFSKTGQINKRFGYNILSNTVAGGGAIANGVELAAYKNELLAFDGYNVYSYIEANQNWSNRGVAISVITEDKDIVRNGAQQLNPDSNYLLGIQVFAYEDSRGGIRYSVIDQQTGANIIDDAIVDSAAQQPKVISFNGLILIFYTFAAGSTSAFGYRSINPTTPTSISAYTSVATDGYAGFNGFPYDCTVDISTNQLYVAYLGNNSGSTLTGAIQAFYLNSSFVVSARTIIDSTSGIAINHLDANGNAFHGAISIITDTANNIWITWSNGIAVYTKRYATAFGSITLARQSIFLFGGTSICNISSIESLTANTIIISGQQIIINSAISSPDAVGVVSITPVALTTELLFESGVGLGGKLFKYNGNIYQIACYQSKLQSTDFIFLIQSAGATITHQNIIAQITPGIGGGYQTNGMLPETVQISNGLFYFANLTAGKILSEANTIFTLFGVNSTILDFNNTDNFINTTQANTLLIVGGILQGYDGVSVTELGHLLYPDDVAVSSSGGGSLSAGVYQYCATYSWTDNFGQIYESAPSVPVSITVAGGNGVAIVGATLRITNRTTLRTPITINIYRTQANGTTFNMITNILAPLVNIVSNNSWTFTDTLSDASALSNELLYTTGGVLANIAPPANSIITTYNNRVFLAGMSDKLMLWYSQQVVSNATSNTVPPQFCAELNIACDPRGGDITALGLLNGSLVIFKESEIFALAGNGPDATGNNSDFGDPLLITSDVGCTSANSVVIMPKGLMFQSAKGIYLLDQSSNVSYIGAPVEAYNSLTISSATLHSQFNQVIFTTDTGTALVYDYYFDQWSTWSNHNAADAVIFNNTFCYLNTNGEVYQQSQTSFTDGTAPIYLSWTLPNLSFAGLQGYARVFRCYILGSFFGTHTLNVSVAYDFNPNYTQFTTINPASGQSVGGYQIYEFRVDFETQRCTSIRLMVSDNQTSSYNQGYAISSVVFEVGILPGGNRLPTINTYGAQ